MLLLNGHQGRVHALTFAPDGSMLASTSWGDPSIWIWEDLADGQPSSKMEHQHRLTCLAFWSGHRPHVFLVGQAVPDELLVGQVVPDAPCSSGTA